RRSGKLLLSRDGEELALALGKAQTLGRVGEPGFGGDEVPEAFETGDESGLRRGIVTFLREADEQTLEKRLVEHADVEVSLAARLEVLCELAEVAFVGRHGVRRSAALA